MDCTMIDAELVAFHLGALEGEPRATVEEHLAGCARCVRAWLDLKRAVERDEIANANADRPSELARARLRSTVARQLAPRRRLWLIGGGVAAAAALAAILIHHDYVPPVEPRAAPAVDSAAPSAGSLNVW